MKAATTDTHSTVTKINMLFVTNVGQSKELTRNTGGGGTETADGMTTSPVRLTTGQEPICVDSICFVITTRFYDGDTGNNVHCWDDSKANNPIPTRLAWRLPGTYR